MDSAVHIMLLLGFALDRAGLRLSQQAETRLLGIVQSVAFHICRQLAKLASPVTSSVSKAQHEHERTAQHES